eukprot:7671889-Heterocapsa_arctica.AAC.1
MLLREPVQEGGRIPASPRASSTHGNKAKTGPGQQGAKPGRSQENRLPRSRRGGGRTGGGPP